MDRFRRGEAEREKLSVMPAELQRGPDGMLKEFTNAELLRLGPISTLQLTAAPLGPLQRLIKRCSTSGVATALVLLAPLFLAIARSSSSSPGPVFFRQRRGGYNSRSSAS